MWYSTAKNSAFSYSSIKMGILCWIDAYSCEKKVICKKNSFKIHFASFRNILVFCVIYNFVLCRCKTTACGSITPIRRIYIVLSIVLSLLKWQLSTSGQSFYCMSKYVIHWKTKWNDASLGGGTPWIKEVRCSDRQASILRASLVPGCVWANSLGRGIFLVHEGVFSQNILYLMY